MFMEFSAGLMPLETVYPDAFTYYSPLTAVETLPLVNCFAASRDRYRFSLDVPCGFDNSEAMDGYG